MTHLPEDNESNDCVAGNAILRSDRDLLRRFIHDGDEPAFAAIVERHAALVMSVCRRVVGQSPDIDDAFQATFFALSQRPASIYECRSLSGWLYSVAWRTSIRLVRMRNRTMTQPLPDQIPASEPDPLDVIAQANDLASLDDELNRLPQKYRDVLVMRYFAQQTNQEIADQLNESKGAVDGRIRDARRMLRVRLAKRGVEIGVLAIATAHVQSSAAAATPALIQKAISLGAPGIFPSESAALNAAEVAQMKLLTSTGIPLMSKITLVISAGLVFASGLWGMSHLTAFQDALGGDAVAAQGNAHAAEDAGDVATLQGQTSVEPEAPVQANANVAGVSTAVDETSAGAGIGSVAEDGSGEGPTNGSAAENMTANASGKKRRSGMATVSEFSRRGSRTAEQRLNEMMEEERVNNLEFPGDHPLSDILEKLSDQLPIISGQRFRIYTDLLALDQEGIPSLQDVIIKDVAVDEIPVASALDFILRQTDPPLTWIAKDEFLFITTRSAAESDENLILRSYDISRLREISEFAPSANAFAGGMGGGMFQIGGGTGGLGGGMMGMPGGGMMPADNPSGPGLITWEQRLMQIVQEMSSPPCSWLDVDGQGGRLTVAGNRLLVRQTREGHRAVIEVLEQLELAAEESTPE